MKNKSITKWLHLTELGGDPWVLPIWTAVNDAYNEKKISPLPKDINKFGLHISIRLNMLPRIIKRINSGCKDLYPSIRNVDQKFEFTPQKEGYGVRIDNDLKYNLLIDIDALLFELNSCCDFMKEFLVALYNHIGKPIKDGGLTIKQILEGQGLNIHWFIELDSHRNFFIHKGTPYIAIDISDAPSKYDLIIMKKNLKKFDNPKDFLLLSDLDKIVRGFASGKGAIQRNLISIFKNP